MCVTPGGDWVRLWRSCLLGELVLGPPRRCNSSCLYPAWATRQELQSNLQVSATCAGLGNAKERPSYKRLSAPCSLSSPLLWYAHNSQFS